MFPPSSYNVSEREVHVRSKEHVDRISAGVKVRSRCEGNGLPVSYRSDWPIGFPRFCTEKTAATVYKLGTENVNKSASILALEDIPESFAEDFPGALCVLLQTAKMGIPLLFPLRGELWYSGLTEITIFIRDSLKAFESGKSASIRPQGDDEKGSRVTKTEDSSKKI
jgi:hypothetical protein